MVRPVLAIVLGAVATACVARETRGGQALKVRPDHPRLFFRTDDWKDGLTVAKVKGWMTRPEYQAHYTDLQGPAGEALRWMITGDTEAARRVISGYDVETGDPLAGMPPCSLARDGEKLTVTVGGSSYTFGK